MRTSPIATILLTLACAATSVIAEGESALPFSVAIGGQAAAVKGDAAHATIGKPVAANAPLEVGVKADMIICNIVPASETGVAKDGATPVVLLLQGSSKTTLDKTMGDAKLAPGTYLIAIVAEGQTAHVLFQIQ